MNAITAKEPILIIGAGAIGGTLAASLTAAGEHVVAVDGNAAHVEAIRANGLVVSGVRPLHVRVEAHHPSTLVGAFNRVILAVKAKDTEAALATAQAHLAPDGWVLPLQNGLGMLAVAAAVGQERTVGAVIAIGAHYKVPGQLALLGYGETHVGELDGVARPRTHEAVALLSHLQPAELTGNILGHAWGKLVLAAIYSATALADRDVPALYDDPEACAILAAAGSEVVTVALAERAQLEPADGLEPMRLLDRDSLAFGPDDVWSGQRAAWRRYANTRTGIWRDLAELHRPTEVNAMLAPVVAAARRHAIATPCLDQLLALVRRAEAHEIALGSATFMQLAPRTNSRDGKPATAPF
ncbi:ketopantoate reductase family protein [Chelatococcus asaccharovorans]|uniref:2-dehydropantoate 2-reductase n=1 Tax=Chelatococcus asaccharovorans TaxID=28210 RepID=A0A2V3UI78_9HYPH|nr:ketopantoate reductase family protein [Chelatococcus asaccharovorans]MBS7706505.1 ketopantoate reductase family protein [Chelatococcus asaccharovorans]PXW64849.1 ketopantoate reductase [Chelatococcus asaccharovorans]